VASRAVLIDVIPEQLRRPDSLLTDDEFDDLERPVQCNGVHVGYIPKMNRDIPIHSPRIRVIAVVCAGCNSREEIGGEAATGQPT
jgi:hypothetical protein